MQGIFSGYSAHTITKKGVQTARPLWSEQWLSSVQKEYKDVNSIMMYTDTHAIMPSKYAQ